MTQFNTTELDFDKIKQNLKDYFSRTEGPFSDWDFEGSGLSSLLDVLAYNTHYNAVNAHMAMNESFLDSAQLRSNVISRAKLLGYTPRSTQAAIATINLTLNRQGSSTVETYTLPEGTKFSSTINNITYVFQTIENVTAEVNGDDQFVFNNLKIYQGKRKKISYPVDTSFRQKFVINFDKADTTTLRVNVLDNPNSAVTTTYTKFNNFIGIDATSPVYFLFENGDGYYDITFGDGILGKALKNQNIVNMDFIVTEGTEANGANLFIYNGVANNVVTGDATVSTVINAQGGQDKETIDSIKFNAPLNFISQNRAVTAEDYKTLITQNIPNVGDVSVWGGEENDIPEYGKVFVSIKPASSGQETLTDIEKNDVNAFLDKRKVISIRPELVDPSFTYIFFEIFAKYNTSLTSLTKSELSTKVYDSINLFNDTKLNNFDGIFRFSKFLNTVDNSDSSITSSAARLYAYKKLDITVVNSVSSNSGVNFGFRIDGKVDQSDSMISSSSWLIGQSRIQLADEPITGETEKRNVYLFTTREDGTRRKLYDNMGFLFPETGELKLNNLPANESVQIEISLRPASDDVIAKQREILTIDSSKTIVIMDIDSSASGTSTLLSSYNTISRDS